MIHLPFLNGLAALWPQLGTCPVMINRTATLEPTEDTAPIGADSVNLNSGSPIVFDGIELKPFSLLRQVICAFLRGYRCGFAVTQWESICSRARLKGGETTGGDGGLITSPFALRRDRLLPPQGIIRPWSAVTDRGKNNRPS
jgi:hypothetical protein